MTTNNSTKNGYTKAGTFLRRLLFTCGIIICFDFTLGHFLRTVYFMQNHGEDYKTTYCLEENRAELLVFGASSAHHHYHPDVFDTLGLSFFNCGRDGDFIFYQQALIRATLRRYKPEIIILDINEEDFYERPDSYDRLASLLPYYKTHPEIREIIEMKSRFEKLKLISRIYPFNSQVISAITGYLDINNKQSEEQKLYGYDPLYNTWQRPIRTQDADEQSFDNRKIEAFRGIINECKRENVKLLVVVSPVYIKRNCRIKFIDLAEEVAQSENIPFLDFSDNELLISDNRYFSDIVHLNNEGAKIFSAMVVEKIMGMDHK